jgi:hypothetical protein
VSNLDRMMPSIVRGLPSCATLRDECAKRGQYRVSGLGMPRSWTHHRVVDHGLVKLG